MAKPRIGIVGATGYVGAECVRYLLGHAGVEIAALAARADQDLGAIYGSFRGRPLPPCRAFEADAFARACDLALVCLPHGASAEVSRALLDRGKRVIDLSADFRASPEAVYGLPEFYRDEVRRARLVANPGCYPTSANLAAAPLLEAGLVEADPVIVDAKSGVTGAGRAPRQDLHLAEAIENLRPYAVVGHRHTPEIERVLSRAAGRDVRVRFTPHLVPMRRGILSTVYLRPKAGTDANTARAALAERYNREPFVRVLPEGALPETRSVRGTNRCDIAVAVDDRTGWVIVLSAIDNMGKGAAGQAVQNANLMLGLAETAGLEAPGDVF